MSRRSLWTCLLVLCSVAAVLPTPALAVPQNPPQFESDYKLPSYTPGAPQAWTFQYVDLAVLALALALAAVLAHRWRSRKGIAVLAIVSLIYFGFYRKGCVCAIGAIQNVVLGVVDPSYAVPLPVMAFFLLPLVFALFFGRVFCGAVCPLGAIQEIMILRPVRLPQWLSQGLRMLAYAYLGLAVLLAATGSVFIVCKYDPFVAFFRVTGSLAMLLVGAAMLLLGLFVARPFCRFLCPLGVLLGHASRLTMWRVKVTPTQCIRCRLCEDSCPVDAIDPPSPPPEPLPRSAKALLAAMLLMLPILTLAGGRLGSGAGTWMAQANSTVSLAQRIWQEDHKLVGGTTNESDAFRATRQDPKSLYAEAAGILRQFDRGGWALGAFLGLVAGLKLIRMTVRKPQADYEAHAAACVACGRCFDACPVHRAQSEGVTVDYLVDKWNEQRH